MTKERIAGQVVAAAFALLIAASPLAARAAGPEDSVNLLHETLLAAMKEGRSLGQGGRYKRIEPAVRRLFDVASMTRLAIGASWATLSPAQQQQVTTAFGAYVAATYADRFDSWAGQRLEVLGREASGSGVVVKTHIVKAGGEAVNVDYLMRQSGGVWQIGDVYLDGTISQLATQRSEFGSILRRQGFDGLIATLQRKVDLLTGKIASAS